MYIHKIFIYLMYAFRFRGEIVNEGIQSRLPRKNIKKYFFSY